MYIMGLYTLYDNTSHDCVPVITNSVRKRKVFNSIDYHELKFASFELA